MENKKPKAKVLGQDSNVFVLMGVCSKALKQVGQNEQAKQMVERVFASHSFHEALSIMGEYCELY